MRDPEGTIEFQGQKVIRRIHPTATAKQFLRSKAAATLVEAGRLIPFEFTAPETVESPKEALINSVFWRGWRAKWTTDEPFKPIFRSS